MKTIMQRFMDKVDKTSPNGCWIWIGSVGSNGYGGFAVTIGTKKQKFYLAHRMSWILHNGDIPDGLCVLHNCPTKDNPLCVNPAHLWIGTKLENAVDASKKGTIYRMKGSDNPKSKLHESKLPEIEELYSRGWTQWDLADKYGVHQGTISKFLLGKTWKHMLTRPSSCSRPDARL